MTAPATATELREAASRRPLKVGVAGLGVGSAMIIRTLDKTREAEVIAAADIRREALDAFQARNGGRVYESVDKLCADPDVEVVWVATPNQLHCEHVLAAAQHGKHIICVKPMALSVEECARMVEGADKNGVFLVCQSSASNSPIQEMRRIINTGQVGRVMAIANWMYSDWLLKPRMPEEYDVSLGGGVVYRHGPHIIDAIRTVGSGKLRSVRAMVGAWLPERPAPGNWSAYLEFEDGTPATVSYSGYGYFNTADLVWGIGDRMYAEAEAVSVRKALRANALDVAGQKEELRQATRAGLPNPARAGEAPSASGNWFGITVVSCERGNIRQSPNGLLVYDDEGHHQVAVPSGREVGYPELRELRDAISLGAPIPHDGHWGMATLEVLAAVMQSARERREIFLTHQSPYVDSESPRPQPAIR